MINPKEYFKATFKRIRKTGCIIFRNKVANQSGYPVIKRLGKQYLYTRYLWAKTKGPIPEGMILRHTCDNPSCVNLNHLILGTHADNVADRVARNRSAIGSQNGRAKLSENQVRQIKANDSLNNNQLSKMYKVDWNVIRNIKSGRAWKHVTA